MSLEKYREILNFSRPISSKHAPMSLSDRAAQFSPFAALTGYEDMIDESSRFVDSRPMEDETGQLLLNEKLNLLNSHRKEKPEIVVFYFEEDSRKEGGFCQRIEGRVRKIDEYEQILILEENIRIDFRDILSLEGSFFDLYGL